MAREGAAKGALAPCRRISVTIGVTMTLYTDRKVEWFKVEPKTGPSDDGPVLSE